MNNMCNIQKSDLKWFYSIRAEIRYSIDLGEYNTYGIELRRTGKVEIIHDVSANEETAKWITGLLNFHKVLPCHFKDIVEDLLI